MYLEKSILNIKQEFINIRRDLHQNPELLYDVFRTAQQVENSLVSYGVDEIVTGLGKTGVVAVVRGRETTSGKVIALRADMDALPIHEQTNLPYASKIEGKMHACGHDGHTAMLLGAAQHLSQTRDFNGTVIFVFQPAEEGGAGGDAMVKDGLIQRFGIQEIYGMHNMPGLPVGQFAIRSGALMAATDRLEIVVEGKGGHAAKPDNCIDPVMVSSHIVIALQSIVSRSVSPLKSAVVSITGMNGGDAFNVIPQTVRMIGTVRTLDEGVRCFIEKRLPELTQGIASAFGATAQVDYQRNYPVTINHEKQTAFCVDVARALVGEDKVEPNTLPLMGGEDFAFMLNACPGAYIFMGNGDSAGLHHPAYDFNDEALPIGIAYWTKLTQMAMPL